MPYTTRENVKMEAGFEQNTDITDTLIDGYITQADSLIDSAISQIYILPLSETPLILEFVARQYAAGLLLKKEYGYEEGAREVGNIKIRNAKDILAGIASKTQILLDADKVVMPMKATGSIRFNPNASSLTKPKFSINQQF